MIGPGSYPNRSVGTRASRRKGPARPAAASHRQRPVQSQVTGDNSDRRQESGLHSVAGKLPPAD